MSTNADIKAHFPSDEARLRKAWARDVEAAVVPETGILSVSAYDADKNFAAQLARTIAYTLVNKGAEYHGGGTGVEIKIVDDVMVSTYPVRPNVILNAVVAVFVGLFIGMAYVSVAAAREAERVMETQRAPAAERGWHFVERIETELEREQKRGQKETAISPRITTMHDHLAKSVG